MMMEIEDRGDGWPSVSRVIIKNVLSSCTSELESTKLAKRKANKLPTESIHECPQAENSLPPQLRIDFMDVRGKQIENGGTASIIIQRLHYHAQPQANRC
jgi:hypothetical protein